LSERKEERFYIVKTTGDLTLPAGSTVRALPQEAVDALDAIANKTNQPAQLSVPEQIVRLAALAVQYMRQRDNHQTGAGKTYREMQEIIRDAPLIVRKANDPIVQEMKGNL
jgi:hypothetical protein